MSERCIQRQEFKAHFRNYEKLNSNLRQYLLRSGFQIMDGKKHWKILYLPTNQLFVISKTPSDFRTGRNFASIVLNTIAN